MFDILHETHFGIYATEKKNRMIIELKNIYCNLTNKTVVYLKFYDQYTITRQLTLREVTVVSLQGYQAPALSLQDWLQQLTLCEF